MAVPARAALAAVLLVTGAHAAPEPVVEGLQMPVDIHVSDGWIWYAELAGNVSRFDTSSGQTEDVHGVEVVTGGERGLVGLALAKDHETSGAFYLYYTAPNEDPDGGINRLVRVVDGQETVLATVPGAVEHNGGRIVVADDGSLFVGTGENQLRDPAQDLDSLLGKILHLHPDGRPAEGNAKGLVHSYGHRNIYGLALHPDTGELWETENSGWRRDEVNRIEPGGNYGYPECEGHGLNGVDDPCPTDKGYAFPVMTFYEDRAAAPTGAAFWQGEFHWASLNEGSVHRIRQDGGAWKDEVVVEHGRPILDLHVHGGDLYFSTMDGIWRVAGPETGDPPPADVEGTPAAWPAVVLGLLVAGLVRRRH